jgi:hypothetical protein
MSAEGIRSWAGSCPAPSPKSSATPCVRPVRITTLLADSRLSAGVSGTNPSKHLRHDGGGFVA